MPRGLRAGDLGCLSISTITTFDYLGSFSCSSSDS